MFNLRTDRFRGSWHIGAMAAAFVALFFSSTLSPWYALGADEPAPPPALAEIVKAVKDREAKIEGLFVSYSIKAKAIAPIQVLSEQMHLLYLESLDVDFAFKGKKRYRKVTEPDFVKALVPSGEGKKFHTMGNMETAFDGEKLLRYSASQDMMDVRSASTAGNAGSWFPQEYLTAIGMSLPSPFSSESAGGMPVRIRDLLSMNGVGKPRWDTVDKARCVVVGIANQQLCWLDPALGYALRKMESFDPASGVRIGLYRNFDFAEIAPGIWFPKTCWFDWCGLPNLPEEHRGKPMVRNIYRVNKLTINDVPDSLFHLDVRPGMRVVDDSRGTEKAPEKPVLFTMPTDSATVDDAVQKVIEERSSGGRFWMYIIALNLVALVLIAGCMIGHRNWQRRRKIQG